MNTVEASNLNRILLLVSIFINVALTIFIFANPEHDDTDFMDANGDGNVDVIYQRNMSRVDRNFDGKYDQDVVFVNGLASKDASDNDFDGYFESTTYFEYGLPIKSVIDRDGDKRGDVIVYYDRGIFSEVNVLGLNDEIENRYCFEHSVPKKCD